MSKVRIERKFPRKGITEEPLLTPKGYKLADPAFGEHRHHAPHAIFVKSLEDAADAVERGLSLWMKDIAPNGKRESLISAASLKVIRNG